MSSGRRRRSSASQTLNAHHTMIPTRSSGRKAGSTWAVGMALCAACALPAQAVTVSLADLGWTHTGSAGLVGPTTTVPLSPAGSTPIGYISTSGGTGNVSPLLLKTDGKGSEKAENGSTVRSAAFGADRGDSLSLWFNFVSTDGRGYDDYAWARLVVAGTNTTAAWLYTARADKSARGSVVPGDVLKRQQDNNLPDKLDAVLDNGNSVGFNVSSTEWDPLGGWSGFCWDSANTCGPTGWIESAYTFDADGRYELEIGVVNWGDTLYDTALAFDFAGLRRDRFAGLSVLQPPAQDGTVPVPATWALLLAGLGLAGRRRGRARPAA